jgi:hypothetical protein
MGALLLAVLVCFLIHAPLGPNLNQEGARGLKLEPGTLFEPVLTMTPAH